MATREIQKVHRIAVRFSGDSGDGMQLTGERFTADTALYGNDLATLPNYPSEIRAPQGTILGVSNFQLQFGDHDIHTPGDEPDVLVAMNPAALKANAREVRPGGHIIVDADAFTPRALEKLGFPGDPLTDGTLSDYHVHAVPLTSMTVAALADFDLSKKDKERSKNMFALGLLSWLFGHPLDGTRQFLSQKFARKPQVLGANLAALEGGWTYGENTEVFAVRYEVAPTAMPSGRYRNITGNAATAYGLVMGAHRAGIQLVLGSYPITPATDILHTLSTLKRYNVMTLQMEDEIAGIGAALGASFAGKLGVTTTSGPGMCLKSEFMGLAVMAELPLVIVDVQRGGPSTGLPTKTEQADLLQALYGRHGESPIPVIAAQSPADCFDAALEACRLAVKYRHPVILLTDGYLGNGSEPWQLPDLSSIPPIDPAFATAPNATNAKGEPTFHAYKRDARTLARPWAVPGTPGLQHRIGGLEKSDGPGAISHDPANHDRMTRLRVEKVNRMVADIPDLDVDDPTGDAELLILGWGSSYGPIKAAVRNLREDGVRVARAHLRHLNPLPKNMGDVLRAYDRVVLPEMNLGQLSRILRAEFLVDVRSVTSVRGLPFAVPEVMHLVNEHLGDMALTEEQLEEDEK